jgi:hypothetical protein
MIRVKFTDAEKQALNHERYHHPHPRVQMKMVLSRDRRKNLQDDLKRLDFAL